MNILTFNHHESYLVSLAATGHHLDVIVRYGDLDLTWNPASRPPPANVRLFEFDAEIRRRLRSGFYDVVICHTIKNLWWMFPYRRCRFIFIAHIPLFFYQASLACKSWLKKFSLWLFKASHLTQFVAVSEFKRRQWGEDGPAIVLTPEPYHHPLRCTGDCQVVVVCNQLLNRRAELGYETLAKVFTQVPVQVIGHNPGLKEGKKPRDFADFQKIVTTGHIYLYTVQPPHGDGYNTAMLEAMQAGMAIVTLPHPSSPIVHGENGLIAQDAAEMVAHIQRLQTDHDEVLRLGKAAQETIRQRFSHELFVHSWQVVLGSV